MRAVAIVAGLILCLPMASAHAAKLTGKITVTKEFLEALDETEREQGEAERSYYWKQPNGIIPVKPPRVEADRDLAVLLFQEGASKPGPDEITTVKVHTGGLEKPVIVTRPGSTIKFRNVDPYDHELYGPDIEGFEPERQSNGAFRPIEFAKEGVFHIRCRLMPHFLGYVVVTYATHRLEVGADGTIVPVEIEAGNYRLEILHAGKKVYEQSFVVGGGWIAPLQINISTAEAGNASQERENKDQKGAAGNS